MTADLFDPRLRRLRRDRAAATLDDASFLLDEAVAGLADRLADIRRAFPRVAVLGAWDGRMGDALRAAGAGGDLLVQLEASPAMAARAGALVSDEALLPLAPGGLDLIVSPLVLHAVGDLPGVLSQARAALRPDGLFIAAMLAGRTLEGLRAALAEAEIAMDGGLSPRVSPMADLRDLGGLLQRAGFALPAADIDPLTVHYRTPLDLMHDLRRMGETNVLREQRRFLSRATLLDACRRYAEGNPAPEGRVAARFEIAYLIGWSPSADQPKPLRPGSASARLADALGTVEIGAGEG